MKPNEAPFNSVTYFEVGGGDVAFSSVLKKKLLRIIVDASWDDGG